MNLIILHFFLPIQMKILYQMLKKFPRKIINMFTLTLIFDMKKNHTFSSVKFQLIVIVNLLFAVGIGIVFYSLYTQNMNTFNTKTDENIVSNGILSSTILNNTENALENQYQIMKSNFDATIKEQVDSYYESVLSIYDRMLSGNITNDTAVEMMINITLEITYGANGAQYIFITHENGTTVSNQAVGPGKNYWNVTDARGVYFFQELLEVAKRRTNGTGDGYYEYWFPHPITNTEEPKRTYAKYFEPYGWVIGTGNYFVDINLAVKAEKESIINSTVKELQKIKIGQRGFVFVIDNANNNTIINHINKELIGTSMNWTNEITGKNISIEIQEINNLFYTFKVEGKEFKAYVSHIQGNWINYTIVTIADVDELKQEQSAIALSAMIIFIAVLSITIVLVFLISNNIVKAVYKMRSFVDKISNNDFTGSLQYRSESELGNLADGLRIMQDTLVNMVMNNRDLAAQLASAAEELSSSSEEVSSSSENIASSQQQISKGASTQVSEISEIQQKVNKLSEGIKLVRDKIQGINDISGLLTNIANQTNMLALNAAIEASRAGDAGKGFNVVAEQVRKLADESKRAVSSTTSLLKEIDEVTKLQEQNTVQIVKSIDGIASVAEETSASTEESAAAAEEQASSMEMISSTSQTLLRYAENLSSELEKLKISVEEKPTNLSKLDDSKREKSTQTKEQKRNNSNEHKTERKVPDDL